MKVLAFNGSPLLDKGNTALILNPFLEGLKEEKVEAELFYTSKLKVNPCLGEKGCWTRTPGKCVQDDDVSMLLPKFRQADIIIFAAPVYVDGMPGPMKTVIDRLIPIMEQYFEVEENHCRHPPRQGHKQSKVVLVSNCGFWEMDNFDLLVAHVKAICRNAHWDYAGALLRPHGPAFGYMLRKGYTVQDVLEAAKNAGKELVQTGKMSEETLRIVSRELLPLDMYVRITNEGFKKALDKLEVLTGKGNTPV